MITAASLCSGYGGLDLAVEAYYGATTIWHSDIDPGPAAIFQAHWPDAPNLGDLTAIDWSSCTPVDVLTAGYPCQPFSVAGRREGANDDRHLWPYIFNAIRVLRPRVTLLENVAGHISLGLDVVLADLASIGADVRWVCIPAADVGAPHRRRRWFARVSLADTDAGQRQGRTGSGAGGSAGSGGGSGDRGVAAAPHPGGQELPRRPRPGAIDPSGIGWGRPGDHNVEVGWGQYAAAIARWENVIGPAPSPWQPTRIGSPILSPRFVEWMMGLPAGWVTDVRVPIDDGDQLSLFGAALLPPPQEQRRATQLHALGNGVVWLQCIRALGLIDAMD